MPLRSTESPPDGDDTHVTVAVLHAPVDFGALLGKASVMSAAEARQVAAAELGSGVSAKKPEFEVVYTTYFDFVWRSARRLGVSSASIDDVVQEVFIVAYRRLPEFRGNAGVKTWLWRILANVVHTYRRTHYRKSRFFGGSSDIDPEELQAPPAMGPESASERSEAVEVLDYLLDQLKEDKRAVFVLVELEQMTVVEAAEVLEVNLNTLHARLRSARQEFEKAARRFRARGVV